MYRLPNIRTLPIPRRLRRIPSAVHVHNGFEGLSRPGDPAMGLQHHHRSVPGLPLGCSHGATGPPPGGFAWSPDGDFGVLVTGPHRGLIERSEAVRRPLVP